MSDQEKWIENPWQGQIVASRGTGSLNLYGSPIKNSEFVTITIKESKKRNQYGMDWYHGGKIIAEVVLSPAQWADLLTRMNVGDGVPCTIRYRDDGGFVPLNAPDPDPLKFGDETGMDENMKDYSNRWRELQTIVDNLAAKGKAGKTDLNNLKQKFEWYGKHFKSNFDFATEQIVERAQKVMNAVRHEIAAITEHAGIKHIQSEVAKAKQLEQSQTKEIESGHS